MGIRNTKSSLRNAIIHLNISADDVSVHDEKFWSQIWQEDVEVAAEVIRSTSTQETRILRDGSPRNFAKLTYKMVERLALATGTLCNTQSQQTAVLNAARILIRLIPCIFENKAWKNFFLDNMIQRPESKQEPELVFPNKNDYDRDYESYLPTMLKSTRLTETNDDALEDVHPQIDLLNDQPERSMSSKGERPDSQIEISNESLIKVLILSTCDLLFCPEFTVLPHTDGYLSTIVDAPPEDLKSLLTCDYVWEAGVGFDSKINSTTYYDKSRAELLRLLLTCLSATLYETPDSSIGSRNLWIEIFTSEDNRHALPLFTSLLNTIFAYKPQKILPLGWIMSKDNRQELVELSIQLLMAALDHNFACPNSEKDLGSDGKSKGDSNLFIEYMSRIHRNEDFMFIVGGFKRLSNNRLDSSYLLGTVQQITFDQELLVLFWRFCNLNQKFVNYLLKTDDVIDIVVSILYHLSENFQDQSKTALIHTGVYNLLILSGERDFGVKLNKAYDVKLLPNLPSFTGSHADLMIIVFHKLILYGLNLNQLYDFMLTILVNISPYLKTLSLLACKCLIQLFEIFSSPFVIFTEPNYHQIIIFLLEIFNNLIQYQFDGNVTMVYVILSKRDAFLSLANLSTTQDGIDKVLNKLKKKRRRQKMAEQLVERPTNECSDEHQNSLSDDKKSELNSQTSRLSSSFQVGATISSTSAQQREVSLVSTPDLRNVTQAIHPFDTIEPGQISQQPVEEPTIDFDDSPDQENQTNLPPNCSTSQKIESREHTTTETSTDEDKIEEFGLSSVSGSQNDKTDAPDIWRPTPERIKQYKLSLPLQSILRMLEVLTPQVEQFKQDNSSWPNETATIRYLQVSTLVGLLPVPHPILIRKYRTNHQTALWFRACTWGMIFVRNPIWTDTDIRLIKTI